METGSYCLSLAGLELAVCRPGWFQTRRGTPASVSQMFLSAGLNVREWSGPFACYENAQFVGQRKIFVVMRCVIAGVRARDNGGLNENR